MIMSFELARQAIRAASLRLRLAHALEGEFTENARHEWETHMRVADENRAVFKRYADGFKAKGVMGEFYDYCKRQREVIL